jgi:hypothetical protein
MKSLLHTILITVGITAAITFGMSTTGVLDGFFYWPNTRKYDPPRTGWPEHTTIRFASRDKTELTGWFFPTPVESAKETVVHNHGSNGNIAYTSRNLVWLLDEGYNLCVRLPRIW